MVWRQIRMFNKIPKENPLLIVKRTKPYSHYEFHYDKKVVFVKVVNGEMVYDGESKVEVVK